MQSQELNQSQSINSNTRSSEVPIYIILLLVTFAFLILSTPAYLFFLINLAYDFRKSPKIFAGYHLYQNTAQKMHHTNHGINFFLYVMSGQKYGTDLKSLLGIKENEQNMSSRFGRTHINMSTIGSSSNKYDNLKSKTNH